jgi:site-specific DNA recombinase
LLKAAAAREFDVIVLDEPSRLSRQDPVDFIEKVVAPLRRAGVRIDTVATGPRDWNSLVGILMTTIEAEKSSSECKTMSRRVLGDMVLSARAGTHFGWMRPYGLRVQLEIQPDTGKVLGRRVIFGPEEEVQAVRFVFDAIANRGWSLRQVCRELEARGVKPPAGNGHGSNKATGQWNAGTVAAFIRNRKYVGDLTWNTLRKGKYSSYQNGVVEQSATPQRGARRNAEADVIIVPDAIPAIIDRETFARAALALQRSKGRTAPKGALLKYLFCHTLICGDCGAWMRSRPDHARKTYFCSRYKEYGSSACYRNQVQEEMVKKAILGRLLDDILSPARLDQVEAEVKRQLDAEKRSGEAERLKAKAQALSQQIDQGKPISPSAPPTELLASKASSGNGKRSAPPCWTRWPAWLPRTARLRPCSPKPAGSYGDCAKASLETTKRPREPSFGRYAQKSK